MFIFCHPPSVHWCAWPPVCVRRTLVLSCPRSRGTAGWRRRGGRLAVIMTLRFFSSQCHRQTDEPCRGVLGLEGFHLGTYSAVPASHPRFDGRRAALDRRRKATVPHLVPKKAVGDGPDEGCLGGSRTKCGGQTLWAATSAHLVSCRPLNGGHCRAAVMRGNVLCRREQEVQSDLWSGALV